MKISRRTLLTMAPAIAPMGLATATTRRALAAAVPETHHSTFDPWVEIHAENVRHNVREIDRRVSGRPILAVIKNNGYGTGVANIGRILDPLDAIEGLAVVKLSEAMALRDAGIQKPVLLMGPFDEKNLEDAVRRDIRPMVYTAVGDVLDRIAEKLQKTIPLHICVDTGMGRVGVPYWDAAPLIRDLAARSSIRIEGIMMTFTEDPEFDKVQLRRFDELCGTLESEGIELGRRHAASSFALFQNPDTFLDMVRPGMAVFGVYSEPPFRKMGILDLRPAMSLKARVVYVKKLPKGESAGYSRAYMAERDVYVATLPVGHADGWPRATAKGARVRIGDKHYPVIASVSASHTIVEIGDQPAVSIGDVATMFDGQEGSRPEDVSAASGTSVYDLTMHLSPLLPRRVL